MRVLVEGWRGINTSYAMVNQYQLLEMKQSDVDLFHGDQPFYHEHWNSSAHSAGFDPIRARKVANIAPPPAGTPEFDVTYRISIPYRFAPVASGMLFVFCRVGNSRMGAGQLTKQIQIICQHSRGEDCSE